MKTFPLFFKTCNKSVVCFGNDEDITRKIRLLIDSGFSINIIGDNFQSELKDYIEQKKINHISEVLSKEILHGNALIISSDTQHNDILKQYANELGIPLNIVDMPEYSDFIFGAIVKRGDLSIGICSNGNAPIVVRNTREFLEGYFDKNYGKIIDLASKYRPYVKEKISDFILRKQFWERFFKNSHIKDVIDKSDDEQKIEIDHIINNSYKHFKSELHSINLDENNIENLTLGNIKKLQMADFIFYQKNINPNIFNYFRRDSLRSHSIKDLNSNIEKKQKNIILTYSKQSCKK